MVDSFFHLIWQLGLFLIVAQTIQHFKPNESYGKYIRILSNIMVLSMFIVPLITLFKKDMVQEFQTQILLYQQQLETINADVGYNEEDNQKVIVSKIEQEIKARLTKGVTEENISIAGVKISGMEPMEDGGYDIDKLHILVLVEKKGRAGDLIQVEPVKIQSGQGEEEEEEGEMQEEQRLQADFARLLGTQENYMEVDIND